MGAELIHYSGPMQPETGQRCTRCELLLVKYPDTGFAAGHRIYVDSRGNDYNTTPMVDITDPDGMLPSEEEHFLSLPDCRSKKTLLPDQG